ncbi:MAG: hypothetical protein ACK557_03545, partial [Planctomycetota bacterium]
MKTVLKSSQVQSQRWGGGPIVWLGLALASATVLAGSEKPGDTPASPPGSFGSHSAGWFSPE